MAVIPRCGTYYSRFAYFRSKRYKYTCKKIQKEEKEKMTPNALSNKKSNFLIFLCWAAYTSAYIGRLNYNASMVEILSQL